MLSKKMESALNGQLNAELFSSYLYLSMAAYFKSTKTQGMAKWMKVQAKEEEVHGMKFFDYIADRGGRVRLAAIEAPESEWASPLAAFEAVYAHEQKVTGLINGLVKLAEQEKDAETGTFLQWFVKEQEEEEETAAAVVQRLKAVEADPQGLREADAALGQRGG